MTRRGEDLIVHVSKTAFKRIALFCAGLIFSVYAGATLQVVSAENVYGDLAKRLGGDFVSVTSVLGRPNEDPHLYSVTPGTAKAVAKADIVIFNGLGYDSWMEHLVKLNGKPGRVVINISTLLPKPKDGNPHLWYRPGSMSAFAGSFVLALIAKDPLHTAFYRARLASFLEGQTDLLSRMLNFKQCFEGLPVAATEPVLNLMLVELGLQVRHLDFQWRVQNEGTPSAFDMEQLLDDLAHHKVRVLIRNAQTGSPLISRITLAAHDAGVPVVSITETQPPGEDYHRWMNHILNDLTQALTR